MRFISLEDAKTNRCQTIKLIATDTDGSLTQKGKLTSGLLKVLGNLERANIQVFIVNRRLAKWVSSLVNYLPIAGAIAENKSLFLIDLG